MPDIPRRSVLSVGGVLGAAALLGRPAAAAASPAAAASTGASVTVDFRTTVHPLDRWSIGGTILTEWGGGGHTAAPVTIVTDATWRAKLGALGPLHWRIPLDMTSGTPSSSERIGGRDDGADYLKAIRSIGGTPYPIVQGNPRDNDFSTADVAAFVHYFNDNGGTRAGGKIERLILGNEPDNLGATGVRDYLAALDGRIAAAKGADPALRVSAPASSHWGNDDLVRNGAAKHAGVDVLSYHAYDGANSGTNPPGFPETRHYFDDMTALRSYRPGLTGYGLEEVNFGSGAGTGPLYDYRNLVWLASVIGQVVTAGGNVSTFADLNGSFGMMNDGNGNDSQPGQLYTTFPAYWAVGMWTGMNGRFRRFGSATVAASSSVALVDVFATSNGKIMLINKDGTHDRTVTVSLLGKTTGHCWAWQTAKNTPTAGPSEVVSNRPYAGGQVTLTLPAGTVTSLDV